MVFWHWDTRNMWQVSREEILKKYSFVILENSVLLHFFTEIFWIRFFLIFVLVFFFFFANLYQLYCPSCLLLVFSFHFFFFFLVLSFHFIVSLCSFRSKYFSQFIFICPSSLNSNSFPIQLLYFSLSSFGRYQFYHRLGLLQEKFDHFVWYLPN